HCLSVRSIHHHKHCRRRMETPSKRWSNLDLLRHPRGYETRSRAHLVIGRMVRRSRSPAKRVRGAQPAKPVRGAGTPPLTELEQRCEAALAWRSHALKKREAIFEMCSRTRRGELERPASALGLS